SISEAAFSIIPEQRTPMTVRPTGIALNASLASVVLALGGCGDGNSATKKADASAGVSFQRVSGSPFGVATTPDGRYAFVDVAGGRVLVYDVTGFVPRLVRTIRVADDAVGCSLTRDGRLLIVASGQGATIVSVARAERGEAQPVLGRLSPPL